MHLYEINIVKKKYLKHFEKKTKVFLNTKITKSDDISKTKNRPHPPLWRTQHFYLIKDPSLNWLASESGSHSPTVKYKIDHNSKTKNRTRKNSGLQEIRTLGIF